MRAIVKEKLEAFDAFSRLDISLHLQHVVLQTSVIPSIEYLLTASWTCQTAASFGDFFTCIRDWYIYKFLPSFSDTVQLDPKSGPLTEALLHTPACAGGGLGLPCYELIYYRRRAICPAFSAAVLHQHPWMRNSTDYMDRGALPFNPQP